MSRSGSCRGCHDLAGGTTLPRSWPRSSVIGPTVTWRISSVPVRTRDSITLRSRRSSPPSHPEPSPLAVQEFGLSRIPACELESTPCRRSDRSPSSSPMTCGVHRADVFVCQRWTEISNLADIRGNEPVLSRNHLALALPSKFKHFHANSNSASLGVHGGVDEGMCPVKTSPASHESLLRPVVRIECERRHLETDSASARRSANRQCDKFCHPS